MSDPRLANPLEETDLALLSYLRFYARGWRMAVKQPAILAALEERGAIRTEDRTLEDWRAMLRESRARLVLHLFPIGVGAGGYFYQVTREDFRKSRLYEVRKLRGMLRNMRRERWAFEAEVQRQLAGRPGEQVDAFHDAPAAALAAGLGVA